MLFVIEFLLKLIFTCFLQGLGVIYSSLLFLKMLFDTFRYGTKIWVQKERRKKPPPDLYKTWNPPASSKLTGPVHWRHCYVTANGLRFHYVTSGKMPINLKVNDVDGETTLQNDTKDISEENPRLLLCLHGFPESWFSWRFVLQSFQENHSVRKSNGETIDYFVVALDMRGCGDSDKPSGISSYHLTHLIADVKAVSLALGYDKFTLLSHDWGGVVAWEFIETHPQMIERFIVLNCPHPTAGVKYAMFHPNQLFIHSWYMYVFMVPLFAEMYVRFNDFKFLDYIMGDKVAGIQTPENQLSKEEFDLVKYYFEGEATDAGINYYRALLLPFYQPRQTPVKQKSKNARFPICLMWGEKDHFMNKGMAKLTSDELPATEPCSRVEMVLNASHWLQQDRPVEVIKHLRQFLSE